MPVILSAAEFEVAPLLSKLSQKNVSYQYISLGVGSLNAARNEKDLVKLCHNKDIFFVGTCGTFDSFKSVELVTIKKVYWLPLCERLGLSWSIEGLSKPFDLKIGSSCLSLPAKVTLASSTISKTSEISAEIRNFYDLPPNCDLVENLEANSLNAIALVARSLHVIMAITNEVCMDGRKQWKQNFVEASEKTASFLIDFLHT